MSYLKRNRLLIVLCTLIMFSCEDLIGVWDVYKIKKGEHHSERSLNIKKLVPLKSGSDLTFKAKFSSSCLYAATNDDINKLYGLTDCNSNIHDNSARFGWRHKKNGTIEIFAYWYTNGKRGFKKIGETSANKEDEYKIKIISNGYYFNFNGLEFRTPRTKNCKHGVRSRLFPYFGGNSPAPHDITIFIYEYS